MHAKQCILFELHIQIHFVFNNRTELFRIYFHLEFLFLSGEEHEIFRLTKYRSFKSISLQRGWGYTCCTAKLMRYRIEKKVSRLSWLGPCKENME